jgi:uncharacterized integral membrane protein
VTIPGQPPPGSGPLGGDPLTTPGVQPVPTSGTEPSAGGPPAGSPQPTGGRQTTGGGQPPAAREHHRVRAASRSLALALLIFVTVVLVLFVVFNTRSTRVSLVFGDVTAPLIVALLIAAVLGGLLVLLATFVTRARVSRRSR